jgi:potassium efflux system protein
LYAFLGDVDNSLSVSSELRYAILSRFREAGIEIPFPQRDLNISGAVKFEPPEGMMEAQWTAADAPQGKLSQPKRRAPRKATRKSGEQS